MRVHVSHAVRGLRRARVRYKRSQRIHFEVSDHPGLSEQSSQLGKNMEVLKHCRSGVVEEKLGPCPVHFYCHNLESSRKRETQNDDFPRSGCLVGMSVRH